MRKSLLLFLCSVLVLAFPGCSQAEESASSSMTQEELKDDPTGAFAFRWYQQCVSEKPEENLVLSPLAACRMLGSLYLGSENKTRAQIQKTLGWQGSPESWLESMTKISRRFQNAPEVTMADGIWVQKNYPLEGTFAGMMREMGDAEVRNVDFSKSGTRKEVNQWIRQKTDGKIGELLKTLSPEARLVLTNALVFKGNWKDAFAKENTRKGYFTSLNGEEVRFPIMQREGTYPYLRKETFQWLEMPCDGDRFAMGIFLPKTLKEFGAMERSLTPELLRECRENAIKTDLDLRLPRFAFEGSFQPVPSLKKMGMEEPFLSTADFTPITRANDLRVSGMILGGFLKVDEKGAQAAAASAVEFIPKSVSETEKPRFYADRPFVFVIYEKETGIILFCGRFVDPKTMEKDLESLPVEGAVLESADNKPNAKNAAPSRNPGEVVTETVRSNFNTSGIGGSME